VSTAAADRRLLYTASFLRALGTGTIGILLGIYLPALGIGIETSGFIVTLGLAGVACSAVVATFAGDRVGRRRCLVGIAGVMAVSSALAAFTHDVRLLAIAAFAGGLNGMGRDRGGALVLEQAMLPGTIAAHDRTRAFAWYNVLQDIGHALGGLVVGSMAVLQQRMGMATTHAARVVWMVYPLALGIGAMLYLRLSPAIEPERRQSVEGPDEHSPGRSRPALTPQTRRVLWRISLLFAMDSVAGGFLTTALLTYFFFERFGTSALVIGGLFAAARVLNAFSHLGAAWLARRIGLVNTMVFTHLPSSFLLVTVAYAPNFAVAAALFLIREALVEMDVPTRQSYVMALVRPEERTLVSGITNIVRMVGWTVGPVLTGFLMSHAGLRTPLAIGAGLKILYDLALWRAFRHIRPPEEREWSQ